MLSDEMFPAKRPHYEPFDDIKIYVTNRWATTACGGEWRTNVNAEFYLKGDLLYKRYFGTVEEAVNDLNIAYKEALMKSSMLSIRNLCDEEGCSNEAIVKYRIKQDHCSGCSRSKEPLFNYTRQFCDEHKCRGDHDCVDDDDNYELLEERVNIG